MLQSTNDPVEPTLSASRISKSTPEQAEFVVIANRLPVQHSCPRATGVRSSPGGLVSALTAVLQNQNGLWIGWLASPARRATADL